MRRYVFFTITLLSMLGTRSWAQEAATEVPVEPSQAQFQETRELHQRLRRLEQDKQTLQQQLVEQQARITAEAQTNKRQDAALRDSRDELKQEIGNQVNTSVDERVKPLVEKNSAKLSEAAAALTQATTAFSTHEVDKAKVNDRISAVERRSDTIWRAVLFLVFAFVLAGVVMIGHALYQRDEPMFGRKPSSKDAEEDPDGVPPIMKNWGIGQEKDSAEAAPRQAAQ